MGLGDNIRLARKAAGLSLGELSRKSGVSKGYLSQLENERILSPTTRILQPIAEVLSTTMDALLRGEHRQNDIGRSLMAQGEARGWTLTELSPADSETIEDLTPQTAEEFQAVYKAIRDTLAERRRRRTT